MRIKHAAIMIIAILSISCIACAKPADAVTAEELLNLGQKHLLDLEYQQALSEGNFDLYYGEVKLTADWDISSLIGTGGALNYGGWANAETDALLAAHCASPDRAETGGALYAHLAEQVPLIPLCFENHSLLTHRGVVEGMVPTAGNVLRNFENWTVHLAP